MVMLVKKIVTLMVSICVSNYYGNKVISGIFNQKCSFCLPSENDKVEYFY